MQSSVQRDLVQCLKAENDGGISDLNVERFLDLYESGCSIEEVEQALQLSRQLEDIAFSAVGLLVAAEKEPEMARKTLEVTFDLNGMKVSPRTINASVGDVIQFNVTNSSQILKAFLEVVDSSSEEQVWLNDCTPKPTGRPEFVVPRAGTYVYRSSVLSFVSGVLTAKTDSMQPSTSFGVSGRPFESHATPPASSAPEDLSFVQAGAQADLLAQHSSSSADVAEDVPDFPYQPLDDDDSVEQADDSSKPWLRSGSTAESHCVVELLSSAAAKPGIDSTEPLQQSQDKTIATGPSGCSAPGNDPRLAIISKAFGNRHIKPEPQVEPVQPAFATSSVRLEDLHPNAGTRRLQSQPMQSHGLKQPKVPNKHKCPRCQREFFSTVNLRRCAFSHRTHRKSAQLSKARSSLASELKTFWNGLDSSRRANIIQSLFTKEQMATHVGKAVKALKEKTVPLHIDYSYLTAGRELYCILFSPASAGDPYWANLEWDVLCKLLDDASEGTCFGVRQFGWVEGEDIGPSEAQAVLSIVLEEVVYKRCLEEREAEALRHQLELEEAEAAQAQLRVEKLEKKKDKKKKKTKRAAKKPAGNDNSVADPEEGAGGSGSSSAEETQDARGGDASHEEYQPELDSEAPVEPSDSLMSSRDDCHHEATVHSMPAVTSLATSKELEQPIQSRSSNLASSSDTSEQSSIRTSEGSAGVPNVGIVPQPSSTGAVLQTRKSPNAPYLAPHYRPGNLPSQTKSSSSSQQHLTSAAAPPTVPDDSRTSRQGQVKQAANSRKENGRVLQDRNSVDISVCSKGLKPSKGEPSQLAPAVVQQPGKNHGGLAYHNGGVTEPEQAQQKPALHPSKDRNHRPQCGTLVESESEAHVRKANFSSLLSLMCSKAKHVSASHHSNSHRVGGPSSVHNTKHQNGGDEQEPSASGSFDFRAAKLELARRWDSAVLQAHSKPVAPQNPPCIPTRQGSFLQELSAKLRT